MARMIPSIISPDTKSSAERKIYKWFSEAPGTDDWVVLHSLGIAKHDTLMEGEVDFLVLVPGKGIFALEVKGGSVKKTDEGWTFTNRYGQTNTKSRGPFEQAKEAIHSIMASLESKVDYNHRHITKLFYSYGVMFPDLDYDEMGIDEAEWQVFDCKDKKDVRGFIMRLSKGAKSNWERVYGGLSREKLPTKQDVAYLSKILRGNFDKKVSVLARIDNAEAELLELTEQQYRCLDQLEDNPRAVIRGAAGTGKTLLALEKVKRESINGKRVALFCYNSNLAEWFKAYFQKADCSETPTFVGTFHQFLTGIINENGNETIHPSGSDLGYYYEHELPEKVVEKILDSGFYEFDELVVDEAQDLIKSTYMDVFDLIIKKGIERGNWTFFGDFTKQAIYAGDISGEGMLSCLEEKSSFIRFKLTINCRNTKQICEEIQTITGYEAPSDIWNKVDGMPVNYLTCSDEEDACEKLKKVIDSLRTNHIANEKITILSPRKRESSIVSLLNDNSIRNYSVMPGKHITFSTIHGFKGLENSVIILTDIDTFYPCQLLYVALSRARSALYIIESKKAESEHMELMKERFLNGK